MFRSFFFPYFLLVTIILSGCQSSGNRLFINPAEQDFSRNEALLNRVLSGPHGYFRFINTPFSSEVCRRFENSLSDGPSLNLHGDAHIEQYAVTDLGRGLTDFDDSCAGPAIIDWIRFGVSLNLTCRENSWTENFESIFDLFLKGYTDALNDPSLKPPEPTIVTRMKSQFIIDRSKYFEWIDSLMFPIEVDEKREMLKAFESYVDNMYAENPRLNRKYFDVVDAGYLKLGIGSALDLKYIVRVKGENPGDPLDDVVLEIKQVRDLSGIDCVDVLQSNNPYRILLGQARIAYNPFKHLGYFYYRDLNFWVHSWVDNYTEIDHLNSFQSESELREVVYDIGCQLGLGHVKLIASPLDLQLRREQLHLVGRYEQELKKGCIDLADLTIDAWKKFTAEQKKR